MNTTLNTQPVGYKAKAFEARNLAFFFLIVFGLEAIMWVLSTIFEPEKPNSLTDPSVLFWAFVVVPTLIGPTLAAFLMTAITEGRPGVKALWRRFWNRNLNIKWLLVTLLGYEVLRLVTTLAFRMIDGQPYPIVDTSNPFWMIIPSFLASFIATGMAEEFGWRGYVLPRFQAKWNALTSSIILGLIWAAWHIPAIINPNFSSPLYQRNFWEFVAGILIGSVLYTWIFNNTKGSVLAAALFHASYNTTVVGLPTDASLWYFYGLLLVVVIIIVIIYGPKNLVRQKREDVV